MPRSKEQNNDLRDERRKQLLKAALKVFACRGYAATKISDIAIEAGFSHGLIHYYFESKEEIYIVVVQQTAQLSHEAIDRFRHMQGSPLEIIRIFIDRNLNYLDAEENALRWLIMIQVAISDSVPSETKALLQSNFYPMEMIQKLIAEGQKIGEIVEGNPERLATTFWSLIQGLILFRYYAVGKLPMPDVEMVLRLFKK